MREMFTPPGSCGSCGSPGSFARGWPVPAGHAAVVVAIALVAGALAAGGLLARAGAAPGGSAAPAVDRSDPWTAAQLERPEDLARSLAQARGGKPLLLHVGFRVLYRAGAIPGSRYVGPGSRPEGIAALKAAVRGLRHDRSIVLYCGCCPWNHCPNMRPAFAALRAMGFTNVRALYVTKDFEHDWAGQGFPVEKPKD